MNKQPRPRLILHLIHLMHFKHKNFVFGCNLIFEVREISRKFSAVLKKSPCDLNNKNVVYVDDKNEKVFIFLLKMCVLIMIRFLDYKKNCELRTLFMNFEALKMRLKSLSW
jgi:hypothetical protein